MKETVKLWHDDVRTPPNDQWVWARTNQEAIEILSEYNVVEISLDHDLGLDHLEPIPENFIYKGDSPDGTGYDLAKWMCANDALPPKITVHSWNAPGGEKMVKLFKMYGCRAVYIPYTTKNVVFS